MCQGQFRLIVLFILQLVAPDGVQDPVGSDNLDVEVLVRLGPLVLRLWMC